LAFRRHGSSRLAAAYRRCAIAGALVISVSISVPINTAQASWSSWRAADWSAVRDRWQLPTSARTTTSVTGVRAADRGGDDAQRPKRAES